MKIQSLDKQFADSLELQEDTKPFLPAYEYLNIHSRVAQSTACMPLTYTESGFIQDMVILAAAVEHNYPDVNDASGMLVEDLQEVRARIIRASSVVYNGSMQSRMIPNLKYGNTVAMQMGVEVVENLRAEARNYRFLTEFENLRHIGDLPDIDLYAEIRNLQKAADAVMAVNEMYTPYFVNGHQLTLHDFMHNFYADFKEQFPSYLLDEAIPVIFNESEVNRARVIPSFIPFNSKPMDFDSGQCDIGNNTSFKLGQRAYKVGEYRAHALVVGYKGIGWVDKGLISTSNETPSRRNSYTPNDILGSALKHSAPYNHSVNDCSMFVGRCLALAGKEVANYSGDLMDDLISAQLPVMEIKSLNDLNAFSEPGMYVLQLQTPPKEKDKPARSRHVYMAIIDKNGQVHVISQAFNIHNREGKIIYPVGPCYQQREDLEVQIQMGRYLRAVKIAA